MEKALKARLEADVLLKPNKDLEQDWLKMFQFDMEQVYDYSR